MDNLCQQQQQRFKEIQTLLSNYKKDSMNRKTSTYIDRKIARLDDMYEEFVDTDEQILSQYKDDHPTHEYWKSRESVAPLVQNFRQELEALRKSLGSKTKNPSVTPVPSVSAGKTSTGNENVASVQAKRYKAQQFKMRQFYAMVREANSTVENEPENVEFMNIKLEAISSKKAEIEKLHEEIYIEAAETEESLPYFVDDYFGTVMKQYEDIRITAASIIRQNQSKYQQATSSRPKLPRIQIPTFDGNFKNWTSFINTFNNLIHDNSHVSDFEKLSYFKESLKGEPSTLIGHLVLQAENYKPAYNIIKERYDNKRKIVAEYIDTMLNIPKVQSNAAKDIRKMHDTLKECIEALRNLGYNVDEWSIILIHINVKKLDYNSLKHYEESLNGSRDFPTMQQFLHLLMERMNVLEALQGATAISSKQSKIDSYRKILVNQGNQHKASYSRECCKYCEGMGHTILKCVHFKQITPSRRIDFINRNKLCTNCLSHNSTEACLKTETCTICNNKHHQLLHTYINDAKKKVSINAIDGNTTTLLSTAKVITKTSTNDTVTLRALIDLGSQVSLITENACLQLGLRQKNIRTSLVGIGGNTKNTCSSIVQLEIQPHFPSEFKLQIEAYVLPRITSNVPEQKIKRNYNSRWENIILADPQYDCPAPIDILLGADVYADVSETQIIRGNPNAMKTSLGWLIVGPATTDQQRTRMVNLSVKEELAKAQELHKFWELEEVPVESLLTKADEQCETIYRQTVKRDPCGRYVVTLPFKENDISVLGASKQRATQRFLQIEKRLQNNERLRHLYVGFMREYIQMRHMTPSSNSKGQFYIPHHAILKENSKESKFRVVFDASMKSTSGLSLNDNLHVGSSLQNNLWSLILRWRKHKIVFGADIIKMYRQIKVAKIHQDYQRILWRENPNQPLREYNLATVTYGTSAAPFLAIRTLHQLSMDEGDNYPMARRVVIEDFYVDDVLTGADNLHDALLLQNQLIQLLQKGQFQLSKWSSNHPKLLQSIQGSNTLIGNLELAEDETIKTLGIHWNPISDCFRFKVNRISSATELTKRQLASEIARQFDPLGWLSPITITSKLILQELWTTEIKWDDKVPKEITAKWVKLRDDLVQLETLSVPRWIGTGSFAKQNLCLHGFCDASEKAYGAVLYSRIEASDGTVITRLLTAKTKVAPTRVKQTLPRLELCGALLLSRLINQVAKTLEVQPADIYAWTDSTIVLAWLQKPATKWKTFVSNRVSEIQNNTNIGGWRHIASTQNPADHASRGISLSKFSNLEQWWTGPEIIKNSVKNETMEMFDTSIDLKRTKTVLHVLNKDAASDNAVIKLIESKSEYLKLLRVTAYLLRFISKISKKPACADEIRAIELRSALTTIVRAVQGVFFTYEISTLKDQQSLKKKSTIASLNPFLDNDGLIRVGGRLKNSDLPFGERHPLILPSKSHLTSLIINWAHTSTLHGTNALTLAFIRKTFWIIRGAQGVRNHIQKCIVCFRFQSKPTEQLMGDLPRGRVTPSRPFTHTGVDYAGPLNIRISKGRGNKAYKGYIAVFVCLSTKAVHIEVVSDLTSTTFLAAFKRFTSRRGNIAHIYSDNGTNFVKANKLLIQNQSHWEKTIQDHFSTQNITWHFIPPSAPHFGGLWEAAVKSLKHHLCRVVGNQTFTYEELSTTLCMIEACLNSRPLCPISNDADNMDLLTSGHFLTGNALLAPPEIDLLDKNPGILTRWELVNQMHQQFWRKWHQEYLSQLQHRTKWKTRHPNIAVGDLVLIKEDNLPPLMWAKGRIKEIHPGKDNLVRAATISTLKGEIKRPTTKLCTLPAVENENRSPSTDEENKPTLRSRSCKIHKTAVTLLTVLSIVTNAVFVTTHPTKLQMHALEDAGGIYFDNVGEVQLLAAHWNLIIRYNMMSYWDEVAKAEKNLQLLTRACNNIQSIHCDIIVQQLKLQFHNIKEENKLLETKAKRHRKRGVGDTIGILLSDTFGILSQREAENYEQHFDLIEQNEQHLLQLAKNQTSIIDNTIRLFKQNNNYTATHLKKLEEHQQQVDVDLKYLQEYNTKMNQKDIIITGSLQMMLILKSMQDTQQNIIEVMLNTQHNTLHRSLVTPVRLQDEINRIREHLSPEMSLPGRRQGDLMNLYRILKTESRITSSNIIIRVRIPLVRIHSYQLFALIPVPIPTATLQTLIIPSSEYLLVDHHREHYAPIDQETFKQCLPINEGMYVCHISPIYTRHSTVAQCEINMLLRQPNMHSSCTVRGLTPTNHWIPVHESNRWIYVTKSNSSKVTFDLICESQIVPLNLQGTGMISISPGCIVKDETLQISSIGKEVTRINTSFLVTANMSQIEPILRNISHINHGQERKSSTTPSSLTTINTHELEEQIEFQKSQETINSHHIHHYTMTHLTFGTILIIMVIVVILWKRSRIHHRPANRDTPQPLPRSLLSPAACSPEQLGSTV